MNRVQKGGAILAARVALIGGHAGLRTVAYLDKLAYNIPMVCFGETRGVRLGDRYTVEECKVILGEGIIDLAAGIGRCPTNPNAVPCSPKK